MISLEVEKDLADCETPNSLLRTSKASQLQRKPLNRAFRALPKNLTPTSPAHFPHFICFSNSCLLVTLVCLSQDLFARAHPFTEIASHPLLTKKIFSITSSKMSSLVTKSSWD